MPLQSRDLVVVVVVVGAPISEMKAKAEGILSLFLPVAIPTFSLGPLPVVLRISLQNISTASTLKPTYFSRLKEKQLFHNS